MSKFDYRSLKPAERRKLLNQFVDIVASLKQKEDIKFFLERLLTESEIVMMMRRLQIAEFLVGGRTYDQIQKKLGVGMSTIQAVDGWLTDAAYEYQLIRQEQKQAQRSERSAKQHAKRTRRGHRPSTMPGTLEHAIAHDSRFILFKILLNGLE